VNRRRGRDGGASFWVTRRLVNPILRPLLRGPLGRRLGRRLAVLRYRGRRTGKVHELVVQYAGDGDRVWIVPGQPERKRWWRNMLAPRRVDVWRAGRRRTGIARVLPGAGDGEAAEGLRAYRAVFPRMVQAPVLVRIDLDPAPSGGAGPSPAATARRRSAPDWHVDLSVPISSPPPDVFSFLADVQDAEPIPHRAAVRMIKEPSGPTAVGTHWHEWVSIAPLWRLRIESVVTDIQAPARLGMDFSSRWFTGHLTYDIERADGGSLLRQRETLRLRTPLGWSVRFVGRRLRPRLEERLRDIKLLIEARRVLDVSGGNPGRSEARERGPQR
jgi:deazaflavin-dependent oxidoreductase (nitroreductase family)